MKLFTRESKKTLVSIFVNPKQFDNKKDFQNYPRSHYNDLRVLKKHKVNYLYRPKYQDIYNSIFEDNIGCTLQSV